MYNVRGLEQVLKKRETISAYIKIHLHNANKYLNRFNHLAIQALGAKNKQSFSLSNHLSTCACSNGIEEVL
jgi:hypothetical protein